MTRILLVEDNEQNWDMLSRRLKRRGFDVTIATDGQQGLDAVRQAQPDLILMDIGLPVMDGWQATRQIRQLDVGQRLPIIALTAHAMSEDRQKALDAGCDDYHTKPVDWPHLLEQIEALLEKRGIVN